jgi:hypothetical protein
MSKPVIVCVEDEIMVLISLRDQLAHHLGTDYDIELAESEVLLKGKWQSEQHTYSGSCY